MDIKALVRTIVPQSVINTVWHLPKAILANLYYQNPSKDLKIIGITGTSGKTTTAHLLFHILNKNGFKVALISTIEAKIGKTKLDTGLHVTNPDPFALQKLLKTIKNKGFEFVVLEVTSHGLDQHRCYGIQFNYGVLTNITHEHLDYHQTFKAYQQTKLKLIKNSSIAVLNKADQSFLPALKLAKNSLEYQPQDSLPLPKSLPGQFNQANLAAAQTVALDLNISKTEITKTLTSFPPIPGRMEFVQTKPFTIIIDFAHKPDALEKALTSVKKLKGKKGRIIAMFGCAGLRDDKKRPIMGRIAAKLADLTILTAEDPRTEDVKDIINQIAKGWRQAKKPLSHRLFRQADRQIAINLAIDLAKPGDYVCFFGKSHEKSMCFGTIEYPWSEHQAVIKALKKKRS